MEYDQLIRQRRSIRSYEKSEISHETLVRILTEASQAPSWKNSQTARCYVLENEELLEAVREGALPSFNRKNSANAILIVTTFVKNISGFSNDGPANEAGNEWGAYDLGLHDAYLVLAASNAGLDTLIMGIRDSAVLRGKLSIPENEEIMSVIALGRRTKDAPQHPSRPLEETVRFF